MSKLYPISVEGEAQFGNLIYHTLRTFLVNPSNSVVFEFQCMMRLECPRPGS